MGTIEHLLGTLRSACAGLADKRQGDTCRYTMADIGMAAFSVFFMQSPSFLAHQRALKEGKGRSNCETLLGMTAIPCDNHIRDMLDGTDPAAFDGVFLEGLATLDREGGLADFQRLDGRLLVALDGTEHFTSRKIKCAACSHRKRSDGGTEYFHSFLAATVVAPGHARVVPLAPEFITPQDGAVKQDCERAAAKRWLAKHGSELAAYRPIYLGDDLFSCQPIVQSILDARASFILTCKQSSHKTISEYLNGVELETHSQTVRKNKKTSTITYKWMNNIPMRDSMDAITVNWFSMEIRNAAGKRTFFNSFITDLPVNATTVADLAACGRARWKIENETFNVLKSKGYHLEHNFGHGKKTLASVLVTLNLLAFAFHTISYLCVLAWRQAVAKRGATYVFFQHLRIITAYIVFPDWATLLASAIPMSAMVWRQLSSRPLSARPAHALLKVPRRCSIVPIGGSESWIYRPRQSLTCNPGHLAAP